MKKYDSKLQPYPPLQNVGNSLKTNILFDISVFSSTDISLRTGIYFVAYNILKKLWINSNYTIILYFQKYNKHIRKLLSDSFLCRFLCLVDTRERLNNNIQNHKEKIKREKKIQKKLLFFLKFIKNYLLLMFSPKDFDAILKTIDIFLSPTCFAPPSCIKANSRIQQFIVLYDIMPLIFPDFYPGVDSENYWYNKLIKSLDKETYYFCISECTKKDFLKFFGPKLDESKMFITYIAPSHSLYPLYDRTMLKNVLNKYRILYNDNDKYILSFCSLEPRKNLIFTIKAFVSFIQKHNIQDLYFYLCGTVWYTHKQVLEDTIDSLGIYKEKIVRLGYVNDEDVNTLYSNALFFTYISKYEGFGLPPLEAMQAGTPVITSDNSSLPEVVGDAAITIDCDSEEQCIKAFEDLYFNEPLRNEYIAKGLERAKLFSWEKTVNKMSCIIDELIKDDASIQNKH